MLRYHMQINYKQTFIDFTKGSVIIAGAGPGNIELITLKVLNAIKDADVIIYDALVNKDLLKFSKKNSKHIFGGKTSNKKACSQSEINEWMIYYARKNKRVLRLKGGDPSFFSRGSQEIKFLKEKKIKYKIFSGISSSQQTVTNANLDFFNKYGICNFITGHRRIKEKQKISDMRKLFYNKGKFIVYMGVGQIKTISNQLINLGMKTNTKVTIVSNASLNNQKIFRSNISEVAENVVRKKILPPSIIVIN